MFCIDFVNVLLFPHSNVIIFTYIHRFHLCCHIYDVERNFYIFISFLYSNRICKSGICFFNWYFQVRPRLSQTFQTFNDETPNKLLELCPRFSKLQSILGSLALVLDYLTFEHHKWRYIKWKQYSKLNLIVIDVIIRLHDYVI